MEKAGATAETGKVRLRSVNHDERLMLVTVILSCYMDAFLMILFAL